MYKAYKTEVLDHLHTKEELDDVREKLALANELLHIKQQLEVCV